ncbi:hypothetical protein EX895_005085 [Sporisorium graminicola]|uniref:Uncharacterized protein n=1 Tax=Sporisorium graminicola TaxID=280036 RepID=A0A4U7KPI0_9BASI|nr:hypothetical protein EX895_005085 [Sporisorium graminicola]TKY86260.1 hypothetical protein EX895_005085 [Sporisorium graminicola]
MTSIAGAEASVHENASSAIISLSWAFLVIPCIFLVGAFAWILHNFSQPSEFPQTNGFAHAEHNLDERDLGDDDEKEQLLDAFSETQSHSVNRSAAHVPSASVESSSSSSWKINGKFSTTSRSGSVYSSYPDPSATYTPSPKSARPSSPRSSRVVGSKAAKVLALNRDRRVQDLEDLDSVDRDELQRSSSRTSDTRKSD